MIAEEKQHIIKSISLLISVLSLTIPSYAKYSGGTGEPKDPYQIAEPNDWVELMNTSADWNKNFIMTADIDMNRVSLTPVGNNSTKFTGIFDGNDSIVYNIDVNLPENDYIGLFGYVSSNGQINNLGLENLKITGDEYVGGLVGYNSGDVNNCYSTGTVSGRAYVGGLVGYNDNTVTQCYSTGTVDGDWWYAGGLVGNNHCNVNDCYSTGIVNGYRYVGGFVGKNFDNVTQCYSTGTVSGELFVGGFVGDNSKGYVNDCFWDIETSLILIGVGDKYPDPNGIAGKTTAEMQTESTFTDAGWDFVGETENGPNDIWKIVEGYTYPLLYWQKYGGGTGGLNDPYLIYTAEHLNDLGAEPNDYNKHLKLMADIDLSEYLYDRALIAWDTNEVEIAFQGTVFTGVFNGNNHTISHMTITGTSYLGLFGQLGYGATISNLALEAVDVNGSGTLVGSLAGLNSGRISNCYSTASITSTGGWAGGLVGENNGTISLSYSIAVVSSDYNVVGGLVGNNFGMIISCYSIGAISGYYDVGGLVGFNYEGTIISCYNTGSVSGDSYVGGLVAHNYYGTITSCFSNAFISGSSFSHIGGLVGFNNNQGDDRWMEYGKILSCFWDMETSDQTTSDGGTGLPTSLMQDINTFLDVGWDFVDETANGTCNFWTIQENGYPNLTAFSSHRPTEPNGSGTLVDPYVLKDTNDLGTVWYNPEAYYILESDLDLSEITWNTAVIPDFGGYFDGNGHVIYRLHIDGGGHLGLFGICSSEASISNLGLEAIDVNGSGDNVSSLVGYNDGMITSCYSKGNVSSNWNYAGCFVGYNKGAITSCYSMGNSSGYSDIGEFVGFNYKGTITSCYNAVGELVGGNYNGKITSSFWDTKTSDIIYNDGYTGLPTALMQDINTFLDAGWDFVDETENGTKDIWWMLEGLSYPRLWWELIPEN